MAYTSIMFENPKTGATRDAPVGLAWTTFFFGGFPAMFRGDLKWAFLMPVLHIVTLGVSVWVFLFRYNKLYIRDLVNDGFKAKSIASGDMDSAINKLGIPIPKLEKA